MEKTKIETKKAVWKKIKVDFLKDVPKKYKIDVEGIEDDSDYFHPIIHLDENTIIIGQSDIRSDDVYGLRVELKNPLILPPVIYHIQISFDDENFVYLVNNFEKVKAKLNENFEMIKSLYVMQHELKKIQDNIIYNSISKLVNQDKVKQSLDGIYKVSEFIENQRLAE